MVFIIIDKILDIRTSVEQTWSLLPCDNQKCQQNSCQWRWGKTEG
jgi:hypothetical protein